MILAKAKFGVGQVVYHSGSGMRGVVIDVDPIFGVTADMKHFPEMGKIPPNQIWYHVLVDGSDQGAYVAELGLTEDNAGAPVEHPQMPNFFSGFDKTHNAYVSLRVVN